MRRRSLLASIGVAAAGGAIGTGAFTSVEATRTVNVAVADEDTGLLALTELDSELVNPTTRNRIQIDIDQVIGEGQGVGSRSEYVFDEVFGVTNQGTQTVYVQSEFGEEEKGASGVSPGFYVETTDGLLLGDDAVLVIDPGQTAAIGGYVDIGEGGDADVGLNDGNIPPSPQFEFEATISAEDDQPSDDLTMLDNEGNVIEDEDDGGEIG